MIASFLMRDHAQAFWWIEELIRRKFLSLSLQHHIAEVTMILFGFACGFIAGTLIMMLIAVQAERLRYIAAAALALLQEG